MRLFGKTKKEAMVREQFPWIPLSSIDHLMKVIATTNEKPVLFFKHSTRCGVSAMVRNTFEREWTSESTLCDLYYLDLLNHRDVSDKIVELTGLRHESPQVIVLWGSEIIYDATHSAIDARRIENTLRKK